MDVELVAEGIGRLEDRFPSTDGRSTLRTLTWFPLEGDFCGIVQIVHGMSEHVGRYEGFATVLAQAGYLVVGADHIGHGESVAGPADLGHLPIETGADCLVADAHSLGACYRAAYPDLPFFLFGHSMGSFVARRCCAEHGEVLTGAIICGTGQVPRALSASANALCHLIAKAKGERYVSQLIDGLGVGSYNKGIENPRTNLDWLSVNEANIDAYLADPLCDATFTVGGYASLTSLTGTIVTREHAAAVPKDLPLFFVAGGLDPVGECGKGVVEAVQLYREAGVREVRLKLYPGMRHEILSEDDHALVEADILAWLKDRR